MDGWMDVCKYVCMYISFFYIYTQYSICMYSPFFLGPWPNPRHVLSMSSSDEAMSDRCDSEDDACEKNIKAVGGPPKKASRGTPKESSMRKLMKIGQVFLLGPHLDVYIVV